MAPWWAVSRPPTRMLGTASPTRLRVGILLGAFAINATTGEITVADSGQLDFETSPVFNLTVTVTDAGGSRTRRQSP